jgi:hypothetical protein
MGDIRSKTTSTELARNEKQLANCWQEIAFTRPSMTALPVAPNRSVREQLRQPSADD